MSGIQETRDTVFFLLVGRKYASLHLVFSAGALEENEKKRLNHMALLHVLSTLKKLDVGRKSIQRTLCRENAKQKAEAIVAVVVLQTCGTSNAAPAFNKRDHKDSPRFPDIPP